MNSSDRVALQRYAAAYDALSASSEEAQSRFEDLQTAYEALESFRDYMTNPNVSSDKKKELIRLSLCGAEKTAAFLSLLIDAGRYAQIKEVVEEIRSLLDKRLHIKRAEVYSAKDLSEEQKNRTRQALSSRYGGKVEAVFKTDASLLGGLKISCEGELIDGSIQGRLAKMQEELTK